MKIELKEISVRDLTKGYIDNDENGVVGFDGKLDIISDNKDYPTYVARKDEVEIIGRVVGRFGGVE